mgnify:CR=1 FL=1
MRSSLVRFGLLALLLSVWLNGVALAQHHHGHGHHGHSHAPKDFGRAFAVGTALNLGFVVVEAAAGLITGSLALLADAGHNLTDVAALALSF